MSHAKNASKSVVLLVMRRLWTVAVNFGVMAYLARRLDKAEFGILAVSAILIGFSSAVGTGGIGEYVIYKRGERSQQHFESAFWLNFFLALVIASVLVLVSSFWASVYSDQRVQGIVMILSGSFFFQMLTTIPKAVFRRELNFQPLIFATSVAYTVASVLKVSFAFLGFGVYSLALPELIVTPFLFAYLMFKSGFRPSFKLQLSLWPEVLSYSKGVVGAKVVAKIANDGDTLIVGKLLGVTALGVYNLAFNVSNVFTNNILPIINEVSFPFMAKISEDQKRLQDTYCKMISSIALFSFPLLTLLILIADDVVLIWYGPKWVDAIIPLQILLMFTISRSISSPSGALFQIVARNDLAFYNSVLNAFFILVGVFIGARYGLIGVCLGVTIARVLTGQYQIARAVKLVGLSYVDVLALVLPIVSVNISAAITLYFLSSIIDLNFALLDVLLKSISFIIIYIVFFRWLFPKHLIKSMFLLKALYPSIFARVIFFLKLEDRQLQNIDSNKPNNVNT